MRKIFFLFPKKPRGFFGPRKALLFSGFLFFFLFGCSKSFEIDKNMDPVEITLETNDAVSLAGTFYNAGKNRAVILLHMLGQDRSTWNTLAPKLQKKGYDVLSIDLRGHGESEGNWKDFSDEEFLKMLLDVQAAHNYLNTSSVAIVGASIGANIGLIYGASNPDVKTAVLLSPGIVYRDVDVSSAIASFRRPLLILSGEKDVYSAKSSLSLSTHDSAYSVELYPTKLHGTDLFFYQKADVEERILNWLEQKYPVINS